MHCAHQLSNHEPLTSLYQSLEATLHDFFWNTEPEANEMPLLRAFLDRHSGASLEVGCGSGRLLLPLLENGYSVEGIEISKDMVEMLESDATSKGLSPTIYRADVTQFSADKHYSAITIPAFTLQLLSRELARTVFASLRKLSTDGGGLYFTVFVPWAEILGDLEEDVWHLDKKAPYQDRTIARCFTKHRVSRIEQELHRQHRYEISKTSGKKLEEHHSEQLLQWYLLPELKLMLQEAGWQFSGYDADFQLGYQDADAHILTVYATAASAS